MRGIKNSQLTDLKTEIENLPDAHQKEILKIIVASNCDYTENQNGVFFDIKILDKDIIHSIQKYIRFYNDTQEIEHKRETEETELRIELNADTEA
jgi:septum formation topological specificity factor MinE